jgi:hypothetical protein
VPGILAASRARHASGLALADRPHTRHWVKRQPHPLSPQQAGHDALALGSGKWEDEAVGDDRDAELADTLAEVGRRVGQAMTDALERIRPAFDALAEVASRPEVRAVIRRAEKAMQRRPCLCFCSRAHPADHGICEVLGAVITGQYSSGLLGNVDVPLCAPCAAARAAHEFAG